MALGSARSAGMPRTLFCLLLAVGVTPQRRADAAESAPAETKKMCVDRHEEAQLLRRSGRLLDAREALVMCSQESCPAVVQADCADWLAQVNASLPSVVFKATVDDRDEFDVAVSIDGKPARSHLDGAPVAIDPGPHRITFQRAPFAPIAQDLLIVEGEKNRLVSVAFGTPHPVPAPLPQPSPAAPPPAPGPEPDLQRPVPPLVLVLGGVALAGAGGFIGFGLAGLSQKKDLEGTCKPTCSESELRPVRVKFALADGALAVGVLALAIGGYVYVTRPAKPQPSGVAALHSCAPRLAAVGFAAVGEAALVNLRGEF